MNMSPGIACRIWSVLAGLVVLGIITGCGRGEKVSTPVPILMYHRISDDAPRDLWTVSPADFEAQLLYLKKQGYHSILPQELADAIRLKKALPKRPVILTFDDGDYTLATEAAPLLERHGFKAAAYIITGRLEDDTETHMFYEGHRLLSPKDIRDLAAKGLFEFGVHGHSHRRLTELNDCLSEWNLARDTLRQKTGIQATAAAYPFGAYNPDVVRQTRKAGFDTVMTCGEKIAGANKHINLQKLPRLWARGGVHAFEIKCLSPSEFTVFHLGIPVPVVLRRVYPGIKADEGWKMPAEIPEGFSRWEWNESPPARCEPALEIWDRNRFFRIYPPRERP